MIKNFILALSVLLFLSCKQEYTPRNIKESSIQKFELANTSIRAIEAISDKKVIFAGSGGVLGKTEDGGKTWKLNKMYYQDTIQPHFRSIAKTSNAMFALSIENPALLYKIDATKHRIVYKEEHKKVFYDAMTFIDEATGIAIGDPIDGCTSIIMTKDGGNTWKKIDCSKLPKVTDGEASFAASNTNIAVINNTIWVVTGGAKARVLKSSDKGETWSIFNTPIIQGGDSQGIYSVDFYDEHNGIIIGGDYAKPNENIANKAITSDGGATWTLVADGKSPNYKSCVQYVPGTQGKEIIAVGKTGISFSNDKGITWKDISKEGYYAIQFIDRNTAWLSGHKRMGKLTLK